MQRKFGAREYTHNTENATGAWSMALPDEPIDMALLAGPSVRACLLRALEALRTCAYACASIAYRTPAPSSPLVLDSLYPSAG